MEFFCTGKAKGNRGGGPVDAANLVGYYKADGDVYNSGTTQATDGQTVATWVDASGNSNDVAQSTEANKPTFQTNELNGLPGIQFDGTDFLNLGAALLTAAPISVYVVASIDALGSSEALVDFSDASATAVQFQLWQPSSLSGAIRWSVRDGGSFVHATTSTNISAGVAFLATGIERSSTSRDVYLDGGSNGNNTGSRTPTNIDEFTIGSDGDSTPNRQLTGFVHEVRVYDVAHDSATQAAVEAQMNAKWGL